MGRGGGTRSGTPPGSPLVRSERTLCRDGGEVPRPMPPRPEGSKLGGGEGAPVASRDGRGPSTPSQQCMDTATTTLHGGPCT